MLGASAVGETSLGERYGLVELAGAGRGQAGDDAGAAERATVTRFLGGDDGLGQQPARFVGVGLEEPGHREERVQSAEPPQVFGGMSEDGGALDIGPGRLGTDAQRTPLADSGAMTDIKDPQ